MPPFIWVLYILAAKIFVFVANVHMETLNKSDSRGDKCNTVPTEVET